jgi:hypothetical protein
MTAERAGRAVDRSGSWVSRVELGRIGLRPRELAALLDLYGVTEAETRRELERLAIEGRKRSWWSRYRHSLPEPYLNFLGLEAEAASLLVYESDVVPGLLQTREYAEAIHRHVVPPLSEELIKDRVEVRMRRQDIVRRDEEPVEFVVIMDESILYRPIGDEAVLAAQLASLSDDAKRGNVSLRIVRMRQSLRSMAVPSFTVVHFGDGSKTVYVEDNDGGRLEEGSRLAAFEQLTSRLLESALTPEKSIDLIGEARETAAESASGQPR